MHTCASSTPASEILGIQHLFPAAGAGPFLDAKCGRVPYSATAPVGNHQPAPAVPFLGKRELYTPSKVGFFVFSYCYWNQTCFLCKISAAEPTCCQGGVHGGTPSLHSTAVRSHSPHGPAPLQHCLAGRPHSHSRGAPSLCFGCWLLCCKSCVGVAQKAYLPFLG